MEYKANREAYGKALVEVGVDKNIVVLDADLSSSTKSIDFKKVYPERFFNIGIAELNMVDIAAGFALEGFKVFASSFAVFITGRAFEGVRQSICYQNLDVVLCGSHAGISVGEDGGSHQAICDISLMRSLPNMQVIVPADYNETYKAVLALKKHKGPFYLRTSREKSLNFTTHDFDIGKAYILKEGSDACIFACGVVLELALKASLELEKENINVGVVDVSTIKPLDADTIYTCAKNSKVVFTLEEHSIIGGLGSAISEFLSENLPKKVIRLGINDKFGQSGTSTDLFCEYGFSVKHIISTIKKSLKND
ncbi:Transketolase, C-terminal section [Desulfurella amilsii]|uniref:Transketolase, C-terminal section n=1 Tax=Desulfurella amilsii TaxID=1562698 RepID=A0A1X4XXX4_9BACT|nr:transketolase family protein [Desulfurella amilsii]OSS42364.1 Transketolase, C-terminal section [Desulfurella amilsii]